MTALADIGARLLGGVLERAEALQGGDLSQVMRIRLADGREALVKGGPAPRTEAAMLAAIAASGVPAPGVLAVGDDVLVLDFVPNWGRLEAAWPSLGRVLAILHATTADCFGWQEDYAFGPVAIENGWTANWPGFWAERRLLVHLGQVPSSFAHRIETLAADLANHLPAQPNPALLHGDMWGGNVLVHGDAVAALIDPACYFGHAEVDLAMLGLFDHPGAGFQDGYGTPEPGYAERLPIYRLWPALVHLRLFGSTYLPLVDGLLGAIGA